MFVVKKYEFNIPYGVINVKNSKLKSLKEKPNHKYMINSGIYLLSNEVFKSLKFKNNKKLNFDEFLNIVLKSKFCRYFPYERIFDRYWNKRKSRGFAKIAPLINY